MTVLAGYKIDTKASVKALDTADLITGYARLVLGEGTWYWYKADATDTADDTTILLPTSGTGRWFRISTNVDASNVTNLAEFIEDRLGNSTFADTSTIDVIYDDSSNRITFAIINNSITNAHINSAAAIDQSKISGLTSALAGKASVSHTHVASDVVDFAEAVDDRINGLLVAGSGITITYDDTANTLTLASTGGGGGGGSAITAKDEGSSLGTFDTINFVGSSIAATLAGTTLTVTASAPSSINTTTVTVSSTSPLAMNGEEVVALTGITLATCTNITANYPSRIRAYINSASASADAARSVTIDPTGEHGCLLECVLTDTNLNLDLSPPVDLYGKASSTIYIALKNFDSSSRTISCTLTLIEW